MIEQDKAVAPHPKPHPVPQEDKQAQREKAESAEVAGRHKNDGPKDHKGAR
jgi:hypothetical protein